MEMSKFLKRNYRTRLFLICDTIWFMPQKNDFDIINDVITKFCDIEWIHKEIYISDLFKNENFKKHILLFLNNKENKKNKYFEMIKNLSDKYNLCLI